MTLAQRSLLPRRQRELQKCQRDIDEGVLSCEPSAWTKCEGLIIVDSACVQALSTVTLASMHSPGTETAVQLLISRKAFGCGLADGNAGNCCFEAAEDQPTP